MTMTRSPQFYTLGRSTSPSSRDRRDIGKVLARNGAAHRNQPTFDLMASDGIVVA